MPFNKKEYKEISLPIFYPKENRVLYLKKFEILESLEMFGNGTSIQQQPLLLSAILDTVFWMIYDRRNLPPLTVNEIIEIVGIEHPLIPEKQVRRTIRLATRRGLFKVICSNDFNEPLRYEFNPLFAHLNRKNLKYLANGVTLPNRAICCSKPCPCVKGEFSGCGQDLLLNPPPIVQTIQIPCVEGSFERVVEAPGQTCPGFS